MVSCLEGIDGHVNYSEDEFAYVESRISALKDEEIEEITNST